MSHSGTVPVGDWNVPPRPGRSRALVALVLGAAAPGAVISGVMGLLRGPVPAALMLLVYGAALVLGYTSQGRFTLSRCGARRATEDDARLTHLVTGLAGDLKMPVPAVFTFTGGGPNAFVCRAGGPTLAVSSSFIEAAPRTELEALVAHSLIRLGPGGRLRTATLVAYLGYVAPFVGELVGPPEDIRAAALTRYPPGLIKAIERCLPHTGRTSPLWFVAEHPTHAGVEARTSTLADL